VACYTSFHSFHEEHSAPSRGRNNRPSDMGESKSHTPCMHAAVGPRDSVVGCLPPPANPLHGRFAPPTQASPSSTDGSASGSRW